MYDNSLVVQNMMVLVTCGMALHVGISETTFLLYLQFK